MVQNIIIHPFIFFTFLRFFSFLLVDLHLLFPEFHFHTRFSEPFLIFSTMKILHLCACTHVPHWAQQVCTQEAVSVMFMQKYSRFFGCGLLVLMVSLVGCGSDNPTSTQEEHFEPEGLVLIESGVRFFRYFRGQIDANDGRHSEIEAPVGLTPHWSIKFLDENGAEIDAPNDPDYKFTWSIADPTILAVVQDEGDEGSFEFHLQGLKEGETTIEFQVSHVDHVDFRTIPLEVHVHHEEGEHGEPVSVMLKDEETGNVLAQVSLAGANATSDTLAIANGQTTDHIEVEFVDENGVEFQPEAPHHELGIVVGDSNVLGIDPPVAPEYWAFRLIGKQAGSTTVTLSIVHEGDTEETFAPIVIQVNP